MLLVALLAAASGCGKTSNDLSSTGTGDPNGGQGSGDDDGGSGTGGSGADAGGPAPDSVGAGTGGASATGGMGGALATGGAGPAAGGSGGAPNSGGTLNSGGMNTILDPHAPERRQLAEAACSLADRFPCLTVITDQAGSGSDAELCRAQTEAATYERFNTSCWNEWVAHMDCGIHRTDYCPCTDGANANYCIINPQLNNFGSGCLDTKAALDACENSLDNFGTETGTAGEFIWQVNPGGSCQVSSVEEDVVNRIGSSCSGAPSGGQSCYCNANGHQIFDLVDLTLNGGAYAPWFAKDCQDAARKLAAGVCTDLLGCCFRYDWQTLDGQSVETCGCGSDPSRAGYASCQEFAAAAKGTLVDTCVEWEAPGNFPIEPKPPTP